MQVETSTLPKEWTLWFPKGRAVAVTGTVFHAKAARWRNGALEYLGNMAGESNHSVIVVKPGDAAWLEDVVAKVKPSGETNPAPTPVDAPARTASSPSQPIPKPEPVKSEKKRSHER